jgi:hypothetical protein
MQVGEERGGVPAAGQDLGLGHLQGQEVAAVVGRHQHRLVARVAQRQARARAGLGVAPTPTSLSHVALSLAYFAS